MRWLLNFARPYAPGIPGRTVIFLDRSASMWGEPTKILESALPEVRRLLIKSWIYEFSTSSDIGPSIESAIKLRPSRSVVLSDGYITGNKLAEKLSGQIDAIFCGDAKELKHLKRRQTSPDYHQWKDYRYDMCPKEYSAGAYILWEMTKGRGVFHHFPWGQGPKALIDLMVYRERRIRTRYLPDQHIYLGRRG